MQDTRQSVIQGKLTLTTLLLKLTIQCMFSVFDIIIFFLDLSKPFDVFHMYRYFTTYNTLA